MSMEVSLGRGWASDETPASKPLSITEIILATLARSSDGLTAAEVAERTGMASYNVSGKLSKLAAYGHIDKQPSKRAGTFIWKRKQQQQPTKARA